MVKTSRETLSQSLELQLEEALQMLRLVAMSKRTCIEVQEWLDHNHPVNIEESKATAEVVNALMKTLR